MSKLVLAIFLFISSCAFLQKHTPLTSEDILVQENFSFLAGGSLSQEEVEADLKVLIYAFENAYGGRKYVPQESYKLALTEISNIKAGPISSKDLCSKIEDAMTKIEDQHLIARVENKLCNEKRVKKFRKSSVGQNYAKQKKTPWEINYIKIQQSKVPIISITSFPSHEDPKWNGLLDKILKMKNSAPAIIFDLRGNSGGDDTTGRYIANYIFGQTAPTIVQEIIKSQTPETVALLINSQKIKMMKHQRKVEPIPDYVLKRFNRYTDVYQKARMGQVPIEQVIQGTGSPAFDAQKAFKMPILVLTDSECASSCESTVEVFMEHPRVVTIGENTGGFLHFGNVGTLVLPNSQIFIQMATDFWKYKSGQYLEGIGYTPKIATAQGNDALDTAIDYLKKNLKN